jgi:hypothetical protein
MKIIICDFSNRLNLITTSERQIGDLSGYVHKKFCARHLSSIPCYGSGQHPQETFVGPEGEKEHKLERLYWPHMAVMVGKDFFTAEVLTLSGLKTFYLLFFLHFESRRICLAGATRHQVVFEPESFR